ncbi:MAG: hypothetical protein IJI57_06400 [Flexilinea sp.]|nr:hypothetical protein [Flexilinea sp.]
MTYTIGGNHAGNATQITVLLMDQAYSAGTSVTTGYIYYPLALSADKPVTFTLPEVYRGKVCGTDYYAYILAEDVNGDYETDYASAPQAIKIPYRLVYNPGEGSGDMDPESVSVGDTFKFPQCTFKAPKGKIFDHWKMSGVDGMFYPDGTVEIAANCAVNGVITVTAYYKDAPQATVTTAPDAENLTYAGIDQNLVTKGEAQGGTINYALGTDNTTAPTSGWGEKVPTATAAGTYYVWYKAVGDDAHSDSDPKGCKAEIKPKSITGAAVTLDKTQLTYNGSEQQVTVTKVTIDGLTLTEDDYTVTGNSGTDKGSYTLTVTGRGNFVDTAKADWKIVEKAMTVSAANVNVPYDGDSHGITVTVSDPASGYEIRYGKEAGDYNLKESLTVTDPGSLTVYYRVTADNYDDYEGYATVTIDPAHYTVTVENGKGGGSYAPGETVTIQANDPDEGKVFDKWTSEDGVSFANANAAETSFVMPAKNVTVTATCKEEKLSPYPAVIHHVRENGSRGIPSDLKEEQTITLTVEIRDGDNSYKAAETFHTDDLSGTLTDFKFSFAGEIPKEFTNEMLRTITVSPGSVIGVEKVYNAETGENEELTHNYYLEAQTPSINKKDGKIEITLIWRDERYVPPKGDDYVVYALPEDEIGAYALRKDGTKEYLIFQTYDICMAYLGRDELCRGPERCFHK